MFLSILLLGFLHATDMLVMGQAMTDGAGFIFEGYSPCYKSSDVVSLYANIDAMGAGFCPNNIYQNYDGVDPYRYVSCGSSGYK